MLEPQVIAAIVGGAATICTAVVGFLLAKRQARRSQERDAAAEYAKVKAADRDAAQIWAQQHAVGCFVLEQLGKDRERWFLAEGSMLTLGRGWPGTADLRVEESVMSNTHLALRSIGNDVWVQSVGSPSAVTVNGVRLLGRERRRLQDGDVVSVVGAAFTLTFIAMQR
jgi:hypothetical protein